MERDGRPMLPQVREQSDDGVGGVGAARTAGRGLAGGALAARGRKEQEGVKVSVTESNARRMECGDEAIAPSYKAKIPTAVGNETVVGPV